MAEHRPISGREQLLEVAFHLHRIVVVGPAEPTRESSDVGIDGDAGHSEGVPQHDVGCLATHPRQGDEFVEGVRHFAIMAIAQGLSHPDDIAGLGPEEAGRLDDLLEFLPIRRREIRRGPIAVEQRRCHLVHPDIGALGAQNRRHQQLQRGLEVEFAAGIGILDGENPIGFPGTPNKGDMAVAPTLGRRQVHVFRVRCHFPRRVGQAREIVSAGTRQAAGTNVGQLGRAHE